MFTPKRHERDLIQFALTIVLALCAVSVAVAAEIKRTFPEKPVRVITPYPAGGSTDLMIRIIGAKLGEKWKQPVVVDHRPGAGGNIATELTVRAHPDGYTLLLGTISAISINPPLYPKLPFDTQRDLVPIALFASGYYLLAVPASSTAASVSDFIAFARSKQGQLVYGSGGVGTAPHLAMELLKQMSQVEILHIPYKGTPPALTDLLAGRVSAIFGSTTSLLPQIKAGRVKALAVTAPGRLKILPEVPTVAESGFPGFDVDAWYGIVAPAGTPPVRISSLNLDVRNVTALPEVRERFLSVGLEPRATSPDEFSRIIRRDSDRWAKVIKQGAIRLE